MSNFSHIKLILWDCDGVLVDSERLAARAFYQIISSFNGMQTEDQVFHSLKGGSIYNAIDYVHSTIALPPGFDVEKEYRRISFQLFKNELKAVEGVEEILKGITIEHCVASNGPRIKIIHNLELTNLMSYFKPTHIFSGHDIQKFKPEPDLFLHAARTLKVDVERCLVMEDSVHGVDAAIQAGMSCLAYVEEGPLEIFREKGVHAFRRMSDLKNLLREHLAE